MASLFDGTDEEAVQYWGGTDETQPVLETLNTAGRYEVAQLQAQLNRYRAKLGFPVLVVDGVAGPRTRDALRKVIGTSLIRSFWILSTLTDSLLESNAGQLAVAVKTWGDQDGLAPASNVMAIVYPPGSWGNILTKMVGMLGKPSSVGKPPPTSQSIGSPNAHGSDIDALLKQQLFGLPLPFVLIGAGAGAYFLKKSKKRRR